MSEDILALLAGLAGGVLLGLAARLGRFCTLGAIEDALYGKEWLRMRMWAFAIAISIAATFILADQDLIALEETIYLTQAWNPLASITGGLMFGYGMAMAGSCGFGALARLGGGDMRYFVLSLVIAISAAMAVGGPTAYMRIFLFPVEAAGPETTGIAHVLSQFLAISELVIALAIAGAIGLWRFGLRSSEATLKPSPHLQRSRWLLCWGGLPQAISMRKASRKLALPATPLQPLLVMRSCIS